ncbi:hypothetical protein ABE099_11580 [Paenibacillus turicensis]|uniref:hypothetical protein n=1 Tax=Paenibacillus turicensis TaxID=160487 RepID=UPI003D2A5943
MKDTQAQDLKKIFHNSDVPQIDVTNAVMSKLKENNMIKPKSFFKVGTVVALGSVLLASSAFAASQFLTIDNKKGEVVYEEKRYERPADFDKEKQLRKLKASHYGLQILKPGETGVAYVAGEGDVGELYNVEGMGIGLSSPAELRSKLEGSDATVLDNILKKYKFTGGNLSYKGDSLSQDEISKLTAELEPEARQSDEQYAIKALPNSGKIWNATSNYNNGTVRVTQMRTNEKITLNLDQETYDKFKSEELQIGDNKVIYAEYDQERTLRFVTETSEEGYHIQHFLTVDKSKISKNEMISIAKLYLDVK